MDTQATWDLLSNMVKVIIFAYTRILQGAISMIMEGLESKQMGICQIWTVQVLMILSMTVSFG